MTENYVTGATGFLGSHLVLQLLRQQETVVALVRGEDPRARLLSALAKAGSYSASGPVAADPANLEVITGNLRLPNCGVDIRDIRRAPGGTFWHLAANLRYMERNRADVFADNVDGAREAIRLASSLGCRRFVHVSTAFTCGRQIGHIREQLHGLDAVFNNVYEESKCHAEHLVVKEAEAAGMEWVIARPSIVIGPSTTWSSGGSNSGLYGFVHRLRSFNTMLRNYGPGARLKCAGSMPMNFVAVDWVVRDLLILGKDPESRATIRHLTSDSSATAQETLDYVTTSLDIPAMIATEEEYSRPTFLETMISRQMEFYGNYFRYPKIFERSAPRQPIETHHVQQAVKNFVAEIESDRTRKAAIW